MADSPFAALADVLAHRGDSDRLLSCVHAFLAAETGAVASVLLEHDRDAGVWVATSASPAPATRLVVAGSDARALERVAAAGGPVLLDDLARACPTLAAALGSSSAALARIPTDETEAAIVVGFPAPPGAPATSALAEAARACATAIEWTRLVRAHELQRRVRDLVLALSQEMPPEQTLTPAVDRLCTELATALGARRVTLWMHDRRAHLMRLEGTSDRSTATRTEQAQTVPADDASAAPARGLRLAGPELVPVPPRAPAAHDLLVPLRGRRRALGAVVIEGVAGTPLERAVLLEAARDLGRQLSAVIDNVQLLGEVLRSRRELEDTFDSLADLVVVCGLDQRITYVNRAFADRVGRARDTLRGEPLANWVGSETAAWVAEQAAAAPTPPAVPTRQLDDPVLTGTFVVTVTGLRGQDTRPTGSVTVLRDITEQARLEAERAALREQLAQSEKLAALGQFVAGIAHELNNPLQGVLGHLEFLRATGRLAPSARRELGRIYREADRAAKIVNSLLVFAGKGQRVRRRCGVNQILARALALRAARLKKAGIEVVRQFDPRNPRMTGDPILLQQAFFNIILNAEQAMSGGPGRLDVSTALARGGEWVVIRIRDTGPGLSEAVQSRLFEPFFTTKEVGKGTGLGLAITYGIVQDHGGQIRATNHPEGGALFTIEFPTDKLVIK